MKKYSFVRGFFLLSSFAFVLACSGDRDQLAEEKLSEEEFDILSDDMFALEFPVLEGFEVISSELTSEKEGERFVIGQIRNMTGSDFIQATITISLLNEFGEEVGSTLAETANWPADGVWFFEAPVQIDAVSSFRIESIETM